MQMLYMAKHMNTVGAPFGGEPWARVYRTPLNPALMLAE